MSNTSQTSHSTIVLNEKKSAVELAAEHHLTAPDQALAAKVNGKLVDLSTALNEGDRVEFVDFSSPEGTEIFWHTSAHLLAQAVLRLFHDAKPTIGPPIAQGFYYDFADLELHESDLERIEEEMAKIVKENYRTERTQFSSKAEAKEAFAANPYKLALIDDIPDGELLTAYRQGEFFDLCRGPHLPNIGKIKAIKVLKTAGAYWRGDAKNEMLTRIYAITFPDKKLLKNYLEKLELAKKRDHKILGPKLGLFSLHEEAPGIPFIHPAGMRIWNKLVAFCRELQEKNGYLEIKTPCLMTKELWERSGHWANYREHMFISNVEERDFAIKPMNCPGGMLFFKSGHHSYRELPLRLAEIGHVHRFEPSGSLSGLMRVRGFHQDDAHIFMRSCDIKDEILAALNLADTIYTTFGLTYRLALSTRPVANTIGSDEDWEVATAGLKGALDALGKPYIIQEGDGAFYGGKIDIQICDALDRLWQCGTIQLDMSLPERFDLLYTDEDGQRKRPVMIHRALFGSIERFFGILIEHFGGRFPLWISPRQVRILTVADRHLPFAQEIDRALKEAGFASEIDATCESIGKKVRQGQLEQVNYMLTVGDREVEGQTVSLRSREGRQEADLAVEQLIAQLLEEVNSRRLP
ncbi:MAG: threonine--tRNA ligase [Chlamydiia bacterium]|nr:threonine--tRNA ligase [Chlamydiia bacterium]